jgi:hypothetical protein
MSDAITDLGRLERRLLGVSMAATGALAALGVTWGVLAGSQIVLFDGMYSVIGLGLSWLSLRASALVERGPDERLPFGREALTPLVVTIQGVALLATCIYGSVGAAVRDVMRTHGRRRAPPGPARPPRPRAPLRVVAQHRVQGRPGVGDVATRPPTCARTLPGVRAHVCGEVGPAYERRTLMLVALVDAVEPVPVSVTP